MSIGLVGKKCGMTRVFTEDGSSIPVTVIEVQPNRVSQIKTVENDGYSAVQVTMGSKLSSRVNKPMSGHFAKAGIPAGIGLWEFRIDENQVKEITIGSEFKVSHFKVGQFVDIRGISKGKGYAGTVKRHNFNTQDATHGNSVSHRVPGSIGQRQTPGRVFKGKKMSGHLGDVKCTALNQKIIQIDDEKNLLLVSGAIPGSEDRIVIILPTVKNKKEAKGG